MKFNKYSLILAVLPLALMSCANKTRFYETPYYVNNLVFEDQFLICQLGDIHFSTSSNLERDFEYIKKAIYSYGEVNNANQQIFNVGKPSLIILNGDIFMNATKDIVDRTFRFFESLQIPYAFNYGNHDLQGSYSANYINNYLLNNNLKYSMYKNPFNDNVFGNSNYVINLNYADRLAFQIFIMDSNCFYLGDYDTFHQDQLSWYTRVLLDSNGYSSMPKEIDESTFKKSIVFTHIPIPEFTDAINYYKDLAGSSLSYQDNYCNVFEKSSSSPINSGFYDLMVKMKSTVAIASNHDHINSSDIFYKKDKNQEPIRFIYGEKTTTNLYCQDEMIGATFYSINETPTNSKYGNKLYFNITKIHVPYEGDSSIIWQNE